MISWRPLLVVAQFACTAAAASLPRAEDYLILDAPQYAVAEVKKALTDGEESVALYETYLRALAIGGSEREMWRVWRDVSDRYPQLRENDRLLEEMSWGVLHAGAGSPQPMVRAAALYGAAHTRDRRAVPHLLHGMDDPNVFVRTIAADLSGQMGDDSLRDKLLQRLHEEQVPIARRAVIRSLGALGERRAASELAAVLSTDRGDLQQQAQAAESLVFLADDISEVELESLISNSRAPLRLLGANVIFYLNKVEHADKLLDLLNDSHSVVRSAVLTILGRMQLEEVGEKAVEQIALDALQDPHPDVQLAACWLLMLHHNPRGEEILLDQMRQGTFERQQQVAGVLAAAGEGAVEVIRQCQQLVTDPMACLNLSLALIHQRQHTAADLTTVTEAVTAVGRRWHWQQQGVGNVLRERLPGDAGTLQAAVVEDQMCHLQVLALLCSVQHAAAQPAVETYLSRHHWGVSGMAVSVLMQEGPDEVVEQVESLLDHSDSHIRMQAALILAFWGKDPRAIDQLVADYPKAPRQVKEFILDSLGRVGDRSALSLLTQELAGPYQILRVISAAATIGVINS